MTRRLTMRSDGWLAEYLSEKDGGWPAGVSSFSLPSDEVTGVKHDSTSSFHSQIPHGSYLAPRRRRRRRSAAKERREGRWVLVEQQKQPLSWKSCDLKVIILSGSPVGRPARLYLSPSSPLVLSRGDLPQPTHNRSWNSIESRAGTTSPKNGLALDSDHF